MLLALTLTVSVALVMFGIHLASGPSKRPVQSAAQSTNNTVQGNVSVATVPPTSAPQTSSQASAVATTQSSSSTAITAQSQPTPIPEPTPTSAKAPAPAVVDGASPEATAAIQQFLSENTSVLTLGDAVGGPFTASDTGIVGQYYAQAVIEYHPELAQTPYAVELARIGVAVAAVDGLLNTGPFQPLPASTQPDDNCLFVKATGHRLCNGFRAFWSSHGVELGDADTTYRESLALFGYPISEEFVDPDTGLVVQYFERTKLEYDPSKPQHERVRTNVSSDLVRSRWGIQVVSGIQNLITGE